MTEKEKMLCGDWYNPNGEPILPQERVACKEQCFQYNQTPPSRWEEREAQMKRLLGNTKKELCVESPFWCDYGYRISVGENFYMNHGGVILDAGGVSFGDNVMIGPQCGFHTSGHPLSREARNAGMESARSICVGNSVWIGAGVQVMPGVSIGDDTVIGAGSVVTKDIPAGVLAVGNPCKVLRAITTEEKTGNMPDKMTENC